MLDITSYESNTQAQPHLKGGDRVGIWLIVMPICEAFEICKVQIPTLPGRGVVGHNFDS